MGAKYEYSSDEVQFTSDGLTLAGNLYVPSISTAERPGPGVVLSGPFTGVKEQVTGTYASALAERGIAALAFDHRNFGGSEGTPRQHEDARGKLRDLEAAFNFLRSRPEVDPRRTGACGICLGTSYILRFAAFDPRVKAIALIAGAYNDPLAMRAAMGADTYRQRLAGYAEDREKLAAGGEPQYIPAVAEEGPAAMPGKEPYEYYGTDRAPSPGWKNQVTRHSIAELITLDAMSASDFIAPTPLLVVHGEKDAYCSPETARRMFRRAGEPKAFVSLPTGNHIDLYDNSRFVNAAAGHSAAWFREHLNL